jgi:23S rRNA (cytidine1920-2'-O)/16S rRNA (cytidine1409-2'-O)-methyltransferase
MNKKNKVRADVLLVEQGLAETRQKAQALIMAKLVCAEDKLIEKSGDKLDPNIKLRLKSNPTEYVSRGAYKLEHAIKTFKINLKDKICLDVGASTGGFTQVCLMNDAKKVYAVDVGRNQMHWKIRSDPRVVVMEGINFRTVDDNLIQEKIDFFCVDVSFISLQLIVPSVKKFIIKNTIGVALIKPQFEAGVEYVEKGGIVKDEKVHLMVKNNISDFFQKNGFSIIGSIIDSPILGGQGNKEFLICVKYEENN